MHYIVAGGTRRVRHSDLVGADVSLLCKCGTRCASSSGTAAAVEVFDRHVRRTARRC